jgi:steroid delta-isomerase-like uncharacterized protein
LVARLTVADTTTHRSDVGPRRRAQPPRAILGRGPELAQPPRENNHASMSATEDVAAYRGIIDAVSTGRLDLLANLIADELEDHNPVPGQAPGRAGFVYWAEAARQAFPDLTGSVEDTVAADGKVAGRVSWRGTHLGPFVGVPGTGKFLHFEAYHIVQFEAGRATQWWGTADLLGALLQTGAGLAPPPTGPAP